MQSVSSEDCAATHVLMGGQDEDGKDDEICTHCYVDHPSFPSDRRMEYLSDGSGKVEISQAASNAAFKPSAQAAEGDETQHPALRSSRSRLMAAKFPDPTCSSLSRLLVVPEKKLAFCYIPKVACTQFNLLMNALNGINSGAAALRSTPEEQGIDPLTITKENGWTRAVFVREPTERYLSAHLSKCVRHEDGYLEDDGLYCEPGRVINASSGEKALRENFEASVASLSELQGGGPPVGNPLYDPQRCFCGGLSPDLEGYDYVGVLEKSCKNVHRQVSEMLDIAGIQYDDLETYFPKKLPSDDPHCTHARSNFDTFYEDPNVLSRVRKFYAEDFELKPFRHDSVKGGRGE